MTVCVAAFAAHSKAIVLVSDKALTYGDNVYRPAVQSDTGIRKVLRIGKSPWRVLVSGSGAAAKQIVEDVEEELAQNPQVANSHRTMMTSLSSVYEKRWEEALNNRVLKPRLLNKRLLVARPNTMLPLPDIYFDSAAQAITRFDFSCSLLACGFDDKKRPHLGAGADRLRERCNRGSRARAPDRDGRG